jgi:hypothetical protein
MHSGVSFTPTTAVLPTILLCLLVKVGQYVRECCTYE